MENWFAEKGSGQCLLQEALPAPEHAWLPSCRWRTSHRRTGGSALHSRCYTGGFCQSYGPVPRFISVDYIRRSIATSREQLALCEALRPTQR